MLLLQRLMGDLAKARRGGRTLLSTQDCMNNIAALLTEWAKVITPALLIVVSIQQWWAARAATKRGLAVQASADQAQSAAQDAAEKVVEVATKTEGVRQALVAADNATTTKLDNLTVQTDKVHTLVNSNMGVQLRISSTALRRIADLTKDPADIRIAEEAERLAQDHESKQHKVDVKAGDTDLKMERETPA